MFLRLGDRDVRLVVHRSEVTDADLARAAGLPAPVVATPLTELGLRRGGEVVPEPEATAVAVTVIGGLDSGRCVPLEPGAVVELGRAAGCGIALADPTVSRRHARIDVGADGAVRVHDLGSRNGAWIDGDAGATLVDTAVELPDGAHVRLGATTVAVGRPTPSDRPVGGLRPPTGATGTVPHNRPPRPALPPAPAAVEVPAPPPPAGPRLPLGVAAIVGPLAMAGAMVWLLGNPAFALFALLSPVLAVGNHLEGRRRAKPGDSTAVGPVGRLHGRLP